MMLRSRLCRYMGTLLVVLVSSSFILSVQSSSSPSSEDIPGYVGPVTCTNAPDTIGYENMTALTYDMYYWRNAISQNLIEAQSQYKFIVCPHTTYNFGTDLGETDEQDHIPIIPHLSNSTIQCGENGDANDGCTIRGGWYHVRMREDLSLTGVILSGFQFIKDEHVSLLLRAFPSSTLFFVDCSWVSNQGDLLAEMYYNPNNRRRYLSNENTNNNNNKIMLPAAFSRKKEPTLEGIDLAKSMINPDDKRALQATVFPAMYAGFIRCSFEENSITDIGILNVGGILELADTDFRKNMAKYAIVTNVFRAILGIHGGSFFLDNEDTLGPVFIDEHSTLALHEETAGINNIGVGCEGIFLEKDGMSCLAADGQCDGICCKWGNTTCGITAMTDNSTTIGFDDKDDHDDDKNNEKKKDEQKKEEKEKNMEETSSSSSSSSSSKGKGGCGPGCVASAILVPFLAIFAVLIGFYILRKRGLDKEIETGINFEPYVKGVVS